MTGTADYSVCNYTYDNNNRLTSSSWYDNDYMNRITSYRYDNNGNMTYKHTEQYYDDTGQRISKTVGGVTTNHIWDNSGNIVAENDAIYNRGLGGEIISAKGFGDSAAAVGDQYYSYNGHGDTTNLVQQSGTTLAMTGAYEYDAFGNCRTSGSEGSANPFRYNGQYYDEETGLIYLRNRYYDPNIGRFTQEDQYWNVNNMIYGDKQYQEGETKIPDYFAIVQSGNLYGYCMNDPVNSVDPSGTYGEEWVNSWYRQQMIWMKGVDALNLAGLSISAQMLYHSIRWFYADNVYIKDEWNGVEVYGTDRINGDLMVYTLRNDSVINNEIDWLKSCANSEGCDSIYWSGVLTLNSTTDTYLSLNNATVTIDGYRNANGSWTTRVTVKDVYDFAPEKFNSIDSFKTAIGGAAGTAAWIEQTPIIGAIKTYSITVEFLTDR